MGSYDKICQARGIQKVERRTHIKPAILSGKSSITQYIPKFNCGSTVAMVVIIAMISNAKKARRTSTSAFLLKNKACTIWDNCQYGPIDVDFLLLTAQHQNQLNCHHHYQARQSFESYQYSTSFRTAWFEFVVAYKEDSLLVSAKRKERRWVRQDRHIWLPRDIPRME